MKKTKSLLASTMVAGAVAMQGTIGNAQTGTSALTKPGEEIRPFQVKFSESDIMDLRRRIAATKWPEKETVQDQTQGVQLSTVQALARYWANDYDFHKLEAKLNVVPHFITNIDGLDIHFIHVRSKKANALPIILAHGWPGSFIELMKLIDPLTNPTAYGGKAEDAFDVIIPSMPGYGFSGKPTDTGWGPERIAKAWIELMSRLGYSKYVAQGGDWGALVVELMALEAPPELMAIHTNMPGVIPAEIDKAAFVGAPAPAGLTAEEKHAYEQLAFFYRHVSYAQLMGSRPQTLTGLADSPVGLAAYMLDHDDESYKLIARVFQGKQEGITKDDILDNVTLYWLTNTGVSASRLYWEYKGGYFNVRGVKIPVAVSAFPTELFQAPKSWTQQAYPKLIHFNKLEKGGHFSAWEQPETFTKELRASFRSLRK